MLTLVNQLYRYLVHRFIHKFFSSLPCFFFVLVINWVLLTCLKKRNELRLQRARVCFSLFLSPMKMLKPNYQISNHQILSTQICHARGQPLLSSLQSTGQSTRKHFIVYSFEPFEQHFLYQQTTHHEPSPNDCFVLNSTRCIPDAVQRGCAVFLLHEQFHQQ